MLEEWEQENGEYENFIKHLDSLSGDAFLRGDRSAVLAYEDSICNFAFEKGFSATDEESADSDEDFSATDARNELMRLDSLLKQSVRANSGEAVANYCDSILEQAIAMGPPMPDRRYLGFPLGGLLSVFVFMLAVPPFLLGIILLVVYYSKRSTYKAQLRSSVPPPCTPAWISRTPRSLTTITSSSP